MSENLIRRVFTSLILLSILFVCLTLNKYFWLLLIISVSFICFYEFNNLAKNIWKRKKINIFISNIISLIFLLFLIFSSYELYISGTKTDIIIILLICIFSDIGGYVVGKLIGGRKLTKISPNKTISGSIGSFLFSLLPPGIFLILYEITKLDYFNLSSTPYYENSIIILCLLLSLICQIGDLLISYFKRMAKVKDTGKILPGHGGILDRIDGIIFAIPAIYYLNINFSIIWWF